MRRSGVRVFAELAGGAWLAVGCARVRRCRGRQVLRIELEANPVNGRLCIALADVDVVRQEEARGQGPGHA